MFSDSKMEVEEAAGTRDTSQAGDRQLPDYPNRAIVDAMAVQNATGSLDIMGQLVLNEWELLRHKIREFGVKIRQMSSKVAALTIKRLWNHLLSLLRRHSDSIPKQYELDAALILGDMEKAEVERPPPRDTLLDIRRVLLDDCVEEGVVLKRATAPWRAMPPARRNTEVTSPMKEGDTSAYQLFNRPMTVADDEFDRLSLPSTNFAQSESDKIMSLEAQLSQLTRQLNMIMVNAMPQTMGTGGGGSQRTSRPVSRSHSRASLYQNQQMGTNAHNSSFGHLAYSHQQPHHQQSLLPLSSHQHSPLPTSDDDGVYMHDDSASSYTSPSHTMIPLPVGMQQLHQLQQQDIAAGIRQSMIMTGDASSAIPPPPPLPQFVLQAPPPGMQQQQAGAGHTPLAASPTSTTLVPYHKDEYEEDDLRSLSPPFSPLPPPPPAVVQHLQQTGGAATPALMRVNTQESPLSTAGSRSFLDDINGGNFALRKTSQKSPSDSIRSSTSGEETEQDENTVGPLVKPTTNQLLSRKVSLRRVSADRSPGGTPQNRNRRRAPSLGQDGGRNLQKGEYLAAALAKQFNSIHRNDEDDDQSVTAGDQSWLDD